MEKVMLLKNTVLKNNKKIRLFCFPYAGGGASIYYKWVKESMLSLILICPVQFPGKENRITETPFTNMKDLVEAVIDELEPFTKEPYAIFGHSMGALISYELLKELEKRNLHSPIVLIVAGHRPPHITNIHSNMYKLSDYEFIQNLKNLNGTPEEVFTHPELLNLILPGIRADFEILGKYQFNESGSIDVPLSVYTGYDDDYVNSDSLFEWKNYTKKTCKITYFQGDHFFPWNSSNYEVIENIVLDLGLGW